MDFKNILKKKNYVRIAGIAAALLLLLSIPSLNESLNRSFAKVYSYTRGQLNPDTNIVIINISESDINSLGHWPIKRSYYALLINSLTKYKVKAIGLEIFLSPRFVTQTLYDNLLTTEIKKAGNVVLGSIVGDIYFIDGKYITDSLSYPSPKLLDDNFKTGHLNYFNKNGIKIPLVIHHNGISEKAFAAELSGKSTAKDNGKTLNVNFISKWTKFKHINLIKYFSLVNDHSPQLNFLKGKTVFIGISDPLIASSIHTVFEDNMPGFALHAFALDNILKNRGFNENFIIPSAILFIILVILISVMHTGPSTNRFYIFLMIVFASFLVLTFILFSVFNILLDYSFFILPLVLFTATDVFLLIFERNIMLAGAMDESKLLKSLLASKVDELIKLQKEFDFGTSSSGSLIEKIKSLKEDIRKIKENDEDRKEVEPGTNSGISEFHSIVFRSKSMLNIIDIIKKAAPGDANVLILGESGTGKELAARAVHTLSSRKDNKFVAVNCGALSDTLLESELFGHVKGAFTGAVSDKIGRFEAADNGTIFLDEIAETSENFQVKLLRIIQSGDFEKVGSSKTQHTNIRIIAATNKHLEKEVKEKKFREDLYYRLNVIKIELPPLRDRKEDVEILAEHFLKKEGAGMKLSQAAADALIKYEWKGNVRELEAVIKRAVIFSKAAGRSMIQLADLTDEIVKSSKYNFEDMVIESLREKGFSRSSIIETAKDLGNVSRTLVSENFRGYSLKCYTDNGFDLEKTVEILSGSGEEEVKEKVRSKITTFLRNIETDINKLDSKNFEDVKIKLNSKYKNLPHKFHYYLDEIIKNMLK